jgi:hypothetical protein
MVERLDPKSLYVWMHQIRHSCAPEAKLSAENRVQAAWAQCQELCNNLGTINHWAP